MHYGVLSCEMCLEKKGVLIYSSSRALYGYDLTVSRPFLVANASNQVYALDVDSENDHVYWIDGTRMRRARLNGDEKVVTPPQDLCEVKNASGIAYDWVTRSVKRHRLQVCCVSKRGPRCLHTHTVVVVVVVVVSK